MTEGSNTGVPEEELLEIVERIERLDEEIKGLNGDKSDVFKEAKGRGFDVKILRKVIAARRVNYAERQEQQGIFDLYLEALDRASSRVHARGEG